MTSTICPYPMEPFHPLSHPVGAVMRHAESIGPNDSLARAAWVLREAGAGLVPVVDGGVLQGVITNRTLAGAMETGLGTLSSAPSAMEPAAATIPSFASGAEALRRFSDSETHTLVVVDGRGHYLGLLSASDLYPRFDLPPILPTVGGMATPFGVYLTAGGVRAGAGHFALFATGMLLSALILIGTIAGGWLAFYTAQSFGLGPVPLWVVNTLPIVLFMVALRSIPLSGTHAAEHKVVHALERGEPLELEVVRRMPRVHPRCGTNIAVGLTLFISLSTWTLIPDNGLRVLFAVIATLFLWRPLGNTVQLLITTKPPSDRQLLNGIAAAKELIRNVQAHRRGRPTVWQRIVASGMLHVLGGSITMTLLIELLAWSFGLDLGIEFI